MRGIKKKLVVLVGVACAALFYVFLIEPYLLKITHYRLQNDKLAGVKVVYATDFHFGTKPLEKYRAQKIIAAINQQQADLVLLGGDFVNGHNKESAMAENDLVDFLKQVSRPVYAVLGNHDGYYGKNDILQLFEKADVPVLDNENKEIRLKDKKITIAGVADYYTDVPDFAKAMEGARSPVVLLSHTPDAVPDEKIATDLILAGHTHGGQVVLPFIGAPVVPLHSGRKYWYGLFFENNTPMIVSNGLGTSLLQVRFNNVPEIVVVEFD